MLVVLVIELIIGSVLIDYQGGVTPPRLTLSSKPSMYVQMETDQEQVNISYFSSFPFFCVF